MPLQSGRKGDSRHRSSKRSLDPDKKIEQHDFKRLKIDEGDLIGLLNLPVSSKVANRQDQCPAQATIGPDELLPICDVDSVPDVPASDHVLQRVFELRGQVQSVCDGDSGLSGVETVSESLGQAPSALPPKIKLYNGWTLFRARVLEATVRQPGESARSRVARAVEMAQEQWEAEQMVEQHECGSFFEQSMV